jgi:hypothetical protein
LKTIILLHRNRIYRRLGSVKARRLKGQPPQKLPSLASFLRSLIVSAKKQSGDAIFGDTSSFIQQLERLCAAMNACERTESRNEVPALERMLKAIELETSSDAFIDRVRFFRPQINGFDRKEVRQLQSLAKYWRICKYMATAARKYRRLFQQTELAVLPPYQGDKFGGIRHFIHAEIQVLVHFQLEDASKRPRYIGTSKLACFLCYHFLAAHGHYEVGGTHGQVHPQWTVPDLSTYTESQRMALRQALLGTAAAVKKALEASSATKTRYPPAMQSVLNIRPQPLPTPTASTVTSGIDDLVPTEALRVMKSLERVDSHQMPDQSNALDITEVHGDEDTLPTEKPQVCQVVPGEETLIQYGNYRLFVELEGSPGSKAGTCFLYARLSETGIPVDLDELGRSGTRTINVKDSRVLLRRSGRDPLQLRFEWPTPQGPTVD